MKTYILSFLSGVAVALSLVFILNFTQEPDIIVQEKVVESCAREFSKEALIDEIEALNFKYPEIVIAQAKLETGNFTSDLFKTNNNLFGMKKAYIRISTATGVKNGHATYNCWRDSLLDYAFYTSRFVRANTEEEFLAHIGKYYAQDPVYESKVRRVTTTSNYFD